MLSTEVPTQKPLVVVREVGTTVNLTLSAWALSFLARAYSAFCAAAVEKPAGELVAAKGHVQIFGRLAERAAAKHVLLVLDQHGHFGDAKIEAFACLGIFFVRAGFSCL